MASVNECGRTTIDMLGQGVTEACPVAEQEKEPCQVDLKDYKRIVPEGDIGAKRQIRMTSNKALRECSDILVKGLDTLNSGISADEQAVLSEFKGCLWEQNGLEVLSNSKAIGFEPAKIPPKI